MVTKSISLPIIVNCSNGTQNVKNSELNIATDGEQMYIEDAIKATGHGKFHLILMFVCGFALMGVVVENVNIGFVVTHIRCDMDISTPEQGLLNSAVYIGIVISSHLWGFLADTAGRRRVLLISTGGSFICALLSTLSFNVIMLIMSRLFVGIFVSGVQAATYSYIGEFHSNDTRTKALSFVAMFMPACFIYLPLLAWLIIPMQWEFYLFDDLKISPWRIYLLCSSLLNGINFICLYHLPESPKFLLSICRKSEAMNVLQRMYAKNTGHECEEYPVKDLVNEQTGTALSDVNGIVGILKLVWKQTWPLFVPPQLGNTLKLCYLMFILFSIGHGTFMWYPDFLMKMQEFVHVPYTLCQVINSNVMQARSQIIRNETFRLELNDECIIDRSNTLTFKIILVMGVVFVSISALISLYIDRVDRKKLLIGWLLVCSIFAVSISLIPHFYIMAVCFMILLSCGLCGGIISAISIGLFPTNIRAMATCLILMFGGSNFVGLLLDTNCELIFYLYGALILSCAILCFFLNTNPMEKSSQAKPSNHVDCES